MDKSLKIAVVLSAIDKMSSVINSSVNKSLDHLEKLKKASQTKFIEGGAMIATGVGVIAALNPAIRAFEELEQANTKLKTSMMNNLGQVPEEFEKVVKLSTELGNKLPGATKDFNELFQAMQENGTATKSILEGAGRAAAYLAVDLNMSMGAAGQYAARLQQAAGVANNDLEKFFDTISRIKTAGINSEEMQYAFSRASGTLKTLGLQGLQSAKNMGVFFATLIRNGQSGETAATSFNSIVENILNPKRFQKAQAAAAQYGITFDFFKNGQFSGVEHMIAQFDKLKSLDPTQVAKVVNALTGGGQDAQALSIIIKNGLEGYKKMQAEIDAKASLQQKIDEQLGTLTAVKEATEGTIENLMAAFGEGLEPVLKNTTTLLGGIAEKAQMFLEANPEIAKMLSMATLLSGAFLILGGAIKVIQGIRIAMMALNITMAANPFIAIAMGVIVAVSLIYAYWEPIKKFFKDLWDKISEYAEKAWGVIEPIIRFSPLGIIVDLWEPVRDFFKGLFGDVEDDSESAWDKIKSTIGFDPMPKLKEVWGSVEGFFTSLWESIKAACDFGIAAIELSIKEFVPSVIIDAWNSLPDEFEKKWMLVQQVFSTAFDWFKNYVKGYFDIGADIIKNIIDGITTKLNLATGLMKFLTKGIRQDLLGQKEINAMQTAATVNRAGNIPAPRPINFLQPYFSFGDKPRAASGPAIVNNLPGKPAGAINNKSSHSNYFNNQFTISLTSPATQKDADLISNSIEKKFGQLMKKYDNNKRRVGF